jgi:hypothetical protein
MAGHRDPSRHRLAITLAVAGALTAASPSASIASEDAGIRSLSVRDVDRSAAVAALDGRHHILPRQMRGELANLGILEGPRGPIAPLAAPLPSAPPVGGYYPADLSYNGGQVVQAAAFNNIFVNCPASCWGNPTKFLKKLKKSNFIHVADQYVGSTANGRYAIGIATSVSGAPSFLLDSDIRAIVHAAAAILGTGYNHIYNVFLPSGTDICFDGTAECYSPDVPADFAFCGYHSSVDFIDIGHVLYTVIPFDDVPGCSVPPPAPNSSVIDSTASVLSHEVFETVTDPDPGKGWLGDGYILPSSEIGDICFDHAFTHTVFDTTYETQLEYSNTYHACVAVP